MHVPRNRTQNESNKKKKKMPFRVRTRLERRMCFSFEQFGYGKLLDAFACVQLEKISKWSKIQQQGLDWTFKKKKNDKQEEERKRLNEVTRIMARFATGRDCGSARLLMCSHGAPFEIECLDKRIKRLTEPISSLCSESSTVGQVKFEHLTERKTAAEGQDMKEGQRWQEVECLP